jgi:hypothetical protein
MTRTGARPTLAASINAASPRHTSPALRLHAPTIHVRHGPNHLRNAETIRFLTHAGAPDELIAFVEGVAARVNILR